MDILQTIAGHLKKLVSAVADKNRPMWPGAVDIASGQALDEQHVPEKVYRLIGAPGGSTLYWDQPQIAAAHALSGLTGDPFYAGSADAYVRSFLSLSIADSGMFRWGNHSYYDVCENKISEFNGGHHELRPITPVWDIFLAHAPVETETYIRVMARRHIYDPATGGFNRHDDGKKGHAFLESGGILTESLAWLYSKTEDHELKELALSVARYSYRHKGSDTGLVVNEPDKGRWDSLVATTETGLWAQSLIRAWKYTLEKEFIEMARNAVCAYIEHAYDSNTGQYAGQVSVESGKPVVAKTMGYWPRTYSDPWNTDQWPTHDYPMPLAEACLSLYDITGEPVFLEAVHRWAAIVAKNRLDQTGRRVYTENYGRAIHFLARAGLQLNEPRLLEFASDLAVESIKRLCDNGMLKGYTGSSVYEAVDGVGFLMLALILLETRNEPNLYGFGF